MGKKMYNDLIEQVQRAIERSFEWARLGWVVSFGRLEIPVSSLQQAKELPENFVYREEALDYWSNVEQLGQEAAAYGKKALICLGKNDLKAAEDAIYQALYIERPCEHYSMTWRAVHDSILRAQY
jgi:hypothetical protein